LLSQYSNLDVYFRTVIIGVEKDANGTITSVKAVQRTPKTPGDDWGALLSENLEDWYSPNESDRFQKTIINFTGFSSVIEATEFGDVLLTSGIEVAQGIEIPNETSKTYFDDCGQATTLTFYMYALDQIPPNTWQPPLGCTDCTYEIEDWFKMWTYRRSSANGNHSFDAFNIGDVSLQAWTGQDSVRYLFLPLSTCKSQIAAGNYSGCINITALKYAENRAYGWYHNFTHIAPANIQPHLIMSQFEAGTEYGLSKMPYLRDTRRPVSGINGFRLLHSDLAGFTLEAPPHTGLKFNDTIAIGYYPVDIHFSKCGNTIPSYLKNTTIAPYYIPFRALTVGEIPNLIVAGKTMAQSFHANAATRLHPEEWATGFAAGIAACLMALEGYNTTTDVYNNVGKLQLILKDLGQPLDWDF